MEGGREGGREVGREGGREGGRERGREGGREEGSRGMVGEGDSKGREEAMMLGRQIASMEEWRVEGGRIDEVDERESDGTRHGRREGGSERRRD